DKKDQGWEGFPGTTKRDDVVELCVRDRAFTFRVAGYDDVFVRDDSGTVGPSRKYLQYVRCICLCIAALRTEPHLLRQFSALVCRRPGYRVLLSADRQRLATVVMAGPESMGDIMCFRRGPDRHISHRTLLFSSVSIVFPVCQLARHPAFFRHPGGGDFDADRLRVGAPRYGNRLAA